MSCYYEFYNYTTIKIIKNQKCARKHDTLKVRYRCKLNMLTKVKT